MSLRQSVRIEWHEVKFKPSNKMAEIPLINYVVKKELELVTFYKSN